LVAAFFLQGDFMMKPLATAGARSNLRPRRHAAARHADVGRHSFRNFTHAIALLILVSATSSSVRVVAQTAATSTPASHIHAESSDPFATAAAAAFTLPENIPDLSQNASRPSVRSGVVLYVRDAIVMACLVVWL
jgi:hypothetical protein